MSTCKSEGLAMELVRNTLPSLRHNGGNANKYPSSFDRKYLNARLSNIINQGSLYPVNWVLNQDNNTSSIHVCN